MLHLRCNCGEVIDVPESFVGEAAECPRCGKPVRAVAAGTLFDGQLITARLSIVSAPQRRGEQFFLAGAGPIEVGKLPEKPLSLLGTMVSRNHCRFIPNKRGWKVEDQKSTNGLLVNSKRIQAADLRDGDLVRIGEYEMRFNALGDIHAPTPIPLDQSDNNANKNADDADEIPDDALQEVEDDGSYDLANIEAAGAVIPDAPQQAALATRIKAEPIRPVGSGPSCPCCEIVLAPSAKICVACGIKIPCGRPIVTARGMDENDLAVRAETWISLTSWIIWLGLFPVASEAFGTKKARSVWIIFILTFLTSAAFLIANWGEDTPKYANLMLWVGSPEARQRLIDDLQRQLDDSEDGAIAATRRPVVVRQPARRSVRRIEIPTVEGEVHAYQLVTHALLHGGILHWAGNMLFLLVFGLRVNELIGDLKFSIIYPLLAIASGLSYMLASSTQPLHPCLGASGAIMGLAGMYFVFFPVQHIHVAMWARPGVLPGFRMLHKTFPMRAFRFPLPWCAFNDLLPIFFGESDGVAHWAHLGGFLCGAAIAFALLVARLSSARGADLMSVALGRHAWPLLGKPNQFLEAPIASKPTGRPRVVIPARFA